jgi:hypothetical protein
MKKILSVLFILSISNCYSATGNASDGELFALSVLVIILVILGIGYFIDNLKRFIKTARTKRLGCRNTRDDESNDTFLQENGSLSQVFQNQNVPQLIKTNLH